MAYLYRHVRLDNNTVFYIGIGKDDNTFKRAYNKTRRNQLWKNIVSSTKYKVEIVERDISWEEACEKEKYLIKFFGRICEGSGCLANITSGGDGGDTTNNKICIFKDDKEKRILLFELESYEKLGWKRGFSYLHRKKVSELKTGKVYSNEINKKKGRPGHKHSKDTISKMSKAHKGVKKNIIKCPFCNVYGAPSPMRRWHFDNCKKLNNE